MDLPRITYRPTLLHSALAGAAVALVSGLMVGGYFKAGDRLEGPQPQSERLSFNEVAPEPVSFMTDAAGHIPDYVLGTDFVTPPEGFASPEQTAWADEPTLPEVLETPQAAAPTVEPAAWSAPLPPSVGGDIMQIGGPAIAEARPVTLEDGADPGAFRQVRRDAAYEGATVVASAY